MIYAVFALAATSLAVLGYLIILVRKLQESLMTNINQAAEIRREISELTDASNKVIALVQTNADQLAETKANLAAAIERANLAEGQLAEFAGIAESLDTVEQSLRAVLPKAPDPEPETPVDPQPETPGGGGDDTPVTDPDPQTPSTGNDAPTTTEPDGPAGDGAELPPAEGTGSDEPSTDAPADAPASDEQKPV